MNLDEAVPPNDIEAEDGVLASIFLDAQVLDQVRDTLQPRHFYRAGNGLIFQAMLSCAAAGLAPDTAAVKSRLKDIRAFDNVGGDERLAQLFDAVPSPANAAYFARRICEKAAIRSARTAAVRFISHVDANPREPFSEARRVADELAESAHSAFNGGSGLDEAKASTWTFSPFGRIAASPRPEFVVDHLIIGGARVVLGGEPKKALKTWFLMQLGLCVASGQPFLGFGVPKPGRVLFYSGEEPRWRVQERIAKLSAALGITDPDCPFFIAEDDVDQVRIDEKSHINRLIKIAKSLQVNMIILEPFRRLHHAEENASSEIAPILDELTRLTRETGACVVMSHHTVKNREAHGAAALRGSGDLRSWYDCGIFSEACAEGGLKIEIESRDGDISPFNVALKDCKVEDGRHACWLERNTNSSNLDPVPDSRLTEISTKIVKILTKESGRPMSANNIAERVKAREVVVKDVIRVMIGAGQLFQTDRGLILAEQP